MKKIVFFPFKTILISLTLLFTTTTIWILFSFLFLLCLHMFTNEKARARVCCIHTTPYTTAITCIRMPHAMYSPVISLSLFRLHCLLFSVKWQFYAQQIAPIYELLLWWLSVCVLFLFTFSGE